MPLNSIHNGRGFFSDYWLGSVLSTRKSKLPKLTAAQARKLLWWLSKLHDRVDTVEPPSLTDFRERFARPLLGDLFGYSILEDGGEPRLRLLTQSEGVPTPDRPPLACLLLAPDAEDADNRQTRHQIERALLDHNLNYGFVLTPHALRLVRKPGLGNRGAYLEFAIAEAAESEDIESLDVAWRILRASNFAPTDGEPPLIEELEAQSRTHSARVSEDLKLAVFTAAELLIRGFLEDLKCRSEIAPEGRTLTALRDDALLTLYRLLFILYAESRDERLQTHSLYWKNYSLDAFVESLRRRPDDSIPANRFGYWARLVALFKIFDQGLPPVPGLQNIPPRGGRLFSEKTPGGEFLTKVRLPDRLVARLIKTLATTRPRRGVGSERVSYREMEIEQLGAVYEGLLEYEPRTATGTMIEVKVAGRQFVLPPSELVRLCEMRDLALAGPVEIVAGTEAANLHPENIRQTDTSPHPSHQSHSSHESHLPDPDAPEPQDEPDEESDETTDDEDKGVKKGGHAKLIRRLENGEFYFVPGSARKSSGSFYTVEEIVQYLVVNALGHLVEGRTAAQILMLRIIDIACGSGHFLVGAARYLGRKLLEAYQREFKGEPPSNFSRDLAAKERLVRWETEGEAWCKRCIVEQCLFGVDLNPTAVQLAQVALWIESLAGDRPLSFFEHHIRCGNSLLGTWLDTLHIPPHPDLEPKLDRDQLGLFEHSLKNLIRQALQERRLIDAGPPADIRKDTPQEYEYKADRLKRAEALLRQGKLLFDLRNAAPFVPAIWKDWTRLVAADDLAAFAQSQPWWKDFEEVRKRERFFHWELEFPEVFFAENPGFDTALGNPPWDKVKPDRKEFYGRADILIRAYTGGELDVRVRELHAANSTLEAEFDVYCDRVKTISACLKSGADYRYCDWQIKGKSTGGDPDLFKFFIERAHRILREGGRLSYLVPSAVYNNEGSTGLRHLILDETNVVAFFGFENRHKLFDIDSRYKFVCLVLEKRELSGTVEFNATFMRHDVEELIKGSPVGVEVLIKRKELEKVSPGTLSFPEYRSAHDREIILKMYGLCESQTQRPFFADQCQGTWKAKFYSDFHMTQDRDLWTKPNGHLWSPKDVLGRVPTDFQELRRRMAEAGFWPLYEGKHIEQFLVDVKPVERWLSIEAAEKKYRKPPSVERKLVFRDIASNTNERTCIAAVLPEKSCFGHTLSGLEVSAPLDQAAALLNSLVFDFALRLKAGGTHLSFTFVSRMPLPEISFSKTIPTRPAAEVDGKRTLADYQPAWNDLWRINRDVAEAYDLSAKEFSEILPAFPVLARKRPTFHEFLRERVSEWLQEESKIVRLPASEFLPGLEPVLLPASAARGRKSATREFKQAVMFAWAVDRLQRRQTPASRFRVGKLLYFIEAEQRTGLFPDFLKQAAGPYDPSLRYKGPEDIAVRQRRWLRMASPTVFVPCAIEKCARYFGRYFNPQKAESVLEHFHSYGDDALGRWATVHYAAQELVAQGQPVNSTTILGHLESSPEWAHKPDRREFSSNFVESTLRGMRFKGWL